MSVNSTTPQRSERSITGLLAPIGPLVGAAGIVVAGFWAWRTLVENAPRTSMMDLLRVAALLLTVAFLLLPLARAALHAAHVRLHAAADARERGLEEIEKSMRRLSTNWRAEDGEPSITRETPLPPIEGPEAQARLRTLTLGLRIIYAIYALALLYILWQLFA